MISLANRTGHDIIMSAKPYVSQIFYFCNIPQTSYGNGQTSPLFANVADYLRRKVWRPGNERAFLLQNRIIMTWASKMVPRIAKRDGWYCHYCHTPLSYPELTPIENIFDDDLYNDGIISYSSEQYIAWNYIQPDGTKYPTIDHKLPKSKGGSNKPDNLVLSCIDCNMKKNDRYNYEEFIALID